MEISGHTTTPQSFAGYYNYEDPEFYGNYSNPLWIVVPTAHISENSNFFSDIVLSSYSGDIIQFNNQYTSSVTVGDYTGQRLKFNNIQNGSGTATFSYTYNGVTTSQSFNYQFVDETIQKYFYFNVIYKINNNIINIINQSYIYNVKR